ncbi:leukocyte receptor cluster member 9 isoform X1 [Sparus aurata]|uniref:leukocyte receptor cluster member 9 isoform X1 n=1 Tax=Sparus aurata TaxID=8175 RepID=UPI0011C15D85|nr:leukocyte receptor cluster member 9 isoform X1 [Sparus aurata]XP_030250312.1 leukocyte receptor cluster member 9 isoform X1 [Sparus aurata]XP_030250314.1 leukocyte receptor cluster member 9 isoform X1 [Sparus aurata]
MASDGLGEPSIPPEDQTGDGTLLTDAPSPEARVPSEPNNVKDTLETTTESAERDEDGVNVCQFFLMGKCHFGNRCRLSHSDPFVDDSGAASPDQDDKQDGEKMEKHKKKGNKATKPKFEPKDIFLSPSPAEVNKKPRMRTADDVISRILWDASADSSEFVVGYVDRFLGVLERPFNDFNWDTNPCDCDYSTELALPRHRIQYFTYRGHRVWDRHSRTDRVFGSTGQSLAPPFGGEEEVKGDQAKQQGLETTEEQPPVVCGQSETEECTCAKNTHLEEERLSNMNDYNPESTQPDPKSPAHTSQEQQESRRARSQDSTDQTSPSQKEGAVVKQDPEEEPTEEWQETWEGNDASSHPGALNISQTGSPLEQREEKRGGRPPKKRPTHFITFRANTPAILSCFQQLQKEITSLLPSSAPHWQTSSGLHVTMCLLVLRSPAEVDAAAEILRQFAHLDRNCPVSLNFPVKLKHFNGRVLYLSPQPQLRLQQLNSGLQEAYREKGLLHRDSYNPRYHLTLAKVVDGEVDRIFDGVGDLKVGKGLNFGRLPVNTLHLCVIGGFTDGFYETVCTVTLR